MKKTFLYILPLLAVACSTDEFESVVDSNNDSAQELQGVVMSIADLNWEGSTRTSLTEASHGMTFSWKEGDQVGVYASESMANFNIQTIGSSAKTAVFDGGGFSLTTSFTYNAFSPYNAEGTNKTAVPVSYLGQIQNTNADANHLGAYDYMAARATAYATDKAFFQFSHLGAVMRIKLTVPTGVSYQSLSISSSSTPFITAGTVDLTATNVAVAATETSNDISLALNGLTVNSGNVLTLYMFVAPVDLSSSKLTFLLTDVEGKTYRQNDIIDGKNMQPGNAYGYETTMTETQYVTFTSDSMQTLTMSTSVNTLEYSVNNGSWTALGTSTVAFGGANGNLRLRGKSSAGINAKITFGNNTAVACSGDIRTLLDYENFATVSNSGSFRSLFEGCTQLISAPELPATNLESYCYASMFKGCTSLTEVPELPATALDSGCYQSMFEGCTSLVSAPEVLSATTLAYACYSSMFQGCTQLTSAPELPVTVLADGCYSSMFKGCTSLTTAPELPATTLAINCYNSMFEGCTSLISVPEILPATTLARFCYQSMFQGCTSLTTAPVLPAKTLLAGSYSCMFKNCSSLNYIRVLADNTMANSCHDYWVDGVANTGTIVMSTTILQNPWNPGVPSGWTIEYVDD